MNKLLRKLKGEISKFLEMNGNENAAYQSLQNIAKAVLRGSHISIKILEQEKYK